MLCKANTVQRMDLRNSDTPSRTRTYSLRIYLKDPRPLEAKSYTKNYSRKHRAAIKADEHRYKAFCASERNRVRRQREKWSEEQKERHRELQRERQRKYREKKKQQEKKPVNYVSRKRTQLPKTEREKKKEKNRVSAQKMRDNYSPQKRTAVNEKRRMHYWAKKENKLQTSSAAAQSPILPSPDPVATSTLTLGTDKPDIPSRTRTCSLRICLKDPQPPEAKSYTKNYSQKRRAAIKADEHVYKAFCASERNRVRRQREKWSKEQKERHRELQRERQRKYREKKKQQEKQPVNYAPQKRTQLPKTEREKKKEKNRLSAHKMRDNYAPQKRTAVNEKRRIRYWAKKENKLQASSATAHSPILPFPNPVATSILTLGTDKSGKGTTP